MCTRRAACTHDDACTQHSRRWDQFDPCNESYGFISALTIMRKGRAILQQARGSALSVRNRVRIHKGAIRPSSCVSVDYSAATVKVQEIHSVHYELGS
ncbi:unnamed protein product [Chondrus crispus]|uniref:Uncharacterized protein n=1 Tax=Chondrus crispus TaxID=2769 RepID=R7Q7C1_CHOCR|nr:unnamed protein product [Chondrus crispus]CDF33281.1 unnamed protein product [Chondrus crispus]|eukprot:XP_005713084.1 unnamed protein product [Chondrus crispus]